MTHEAPEQIWIHHADQITMDGTPVRAFTTSAPVNFQASQTEYTRTDIADARSAKLEAENARLRDILQRIVNEADIENLDQDPLDTVEGRIGWDCWIAHARIILAETEGE